MEASEVKGLKLLGFWASPFSLEVEVALKLKGIPYDYQEENLEEGKSVSLIHYNPIYKCVPVLVHDGRPIAESLVILEYLEEISSDPPLLPSDPYSRAMVRFWVDFFYKKLVPPLRSIVVKEGEEQEKVITETREQLRNFERGIADDFPAETPFLLGESPGLLDISLGSTVCWIRVLEELTGSELMSRDTTPVICRRMKAFAELQAVKDAVPEHEMLLAYAQRITKRFLGPNSE